MRLAKAAGQASFANIRRAACCISGPKLREIMQAGLLLIGIGGLYQMRSSDSLAIQLGHSVWQLCPDFALLPVNCSASSRTTADWTAYSWYSGICCSFWEALRLISAGNKCSSHSFKTFLPLKYRCKSRSQACSTHKRAAEGGGFPRQPESGQEKLAREGLAL